MGHLTITGRLSHLRAHSVRCGLDCSQERLQFVRIIMAYPIDEEGRCAVHATSYTAQEILVHAIGMHVLSHLALEHLLIKMECCHSSDNLADFCHVKCQHLA